MSTSLGRVGGRGHLAIVREGRCIRELRRTACSVEARADGTRHKKLEASLKKPMETVQSLIALGVLTSSWRTNSTVQMQIREDVAKINAVKK